VPRLTQRRVIPKLLLLRKQRDEHREERLSWHSLALSPQSHSLPQQGKFLPRHSTATSYCIFCCLPVFPFIGGISAPTLEGIQPSMTISPNNEQNKEGAVTVKPRFPPTSVEERTKTTLPLTL